jgi:hypothetical protein
MTWQRIDEHMYIDDTLVTCAEYQLFIDEMFEQGKYYQPIHWDSYQFPKGQAHDPILGLGVEDGQAFCEWLSKRAGTEWSFRLPNLSEIVSHPLILPSQSPTIYYWTLSVDGEINLVWSDQTYIAGYAFLFEPVGKSSIRMDKVGDDPTLFELIIHAQKATDINSFYRIFRAITHERCMLVTDIRNQILGRARAIDPDFARLLEQDLDNVRMTIRSIVRPHAVSSTARSGSELDQTIARAYALNNEISKLIEQFLDHLVSAEQSLIQVEQLASPGPEFSEGIRLVKERIR